MRVKNILTTLVVLFSLTFGFSSAKANNCGIDGNVSIANMNWLSASFLAELTKIMLESGYDCEVELIPGDSVPTSVGMASKQKPDIAPEMWTGSIGEIVKDALNDGKLIAIADTFTNSGFEAFWIPSYTAEKYPDLKTVDDLKRYPQLFKEMASGGKGRIYGCPPGWACEISTQNLFNAYDLDGEFELFSPGSGDNLKASIARAVKRKRDIVAYYWDPTAVTGQFGLIPLAMDSFDPNRWTCIADPDCENPERTSFAASPVKVMITNQLQSNAPEVAKLLSKFTFENAQVSSILAWAETNSASAEEAAIHFLKTTDDWKGWVSSEISEKIIQSL